eukprot:CAMPEP_0185020762 /NCGR_PEP_ID=MMETSP1103-20130426/3406_1 /TAXON_ID=36769 /ORGANISM="Paraphysomonas bandaiensis, Strain Caron Lab Isolate" /LENGTH=402 /DNA_ID=CAMNT_0027551865 /DNA_START=152 /DNA_END=1360 /DNA_ORIENTATION=+
MYIVQEGDSLAGISIKFNISVARLKKYNHLYGKNDIYVGQEIRLKANTETAEKPFKMLADCHKNSSFKEMERLRASTPSMTSNMNKISQPVSVPVSATPCKPDIVVDATSVACAPAAPPVRALNSMSSFRYKAISDPNLSDKMRSDKLNLEDEIHIFPRRRSTCRDLAYEYSDAETESDGDYEQYADVELSCSPPFVLHSTVNQLHPRPSVQVQSANSSILSNRQVGALARRFPPSIQHDSWRPLYSLLLHGADLNSFYQSAVGHKYSLLVVRAEDGSVFGGFGSETWRPQRKHMFYGGGECFLFKALPDTDDVEVFDWKFENYFFMWSNQSQIAMGGGGGQFGFVLDPDFEYGETNPCDTFGNPRLTPHRLPFKISDVELWGFESFVNPANMTRSIYRDSL